MKHPDFFSLQMKYICLSNYSFIRCTPTMAYIANQRTGKQLVYDSAGSDWLNSLTYSPQAVEDIVVRLAESYEDVDICELSDDFLSFAVVLAEEGFVIVGDSIDEVKSRNRETIKLQSDIPPITDLTIEVTNRCNERCIHCYIPDSLKDKGNTMSLENLHSLVDAFADMGGQTVTLTGGEVFLHKELSEFLHQIHQRKLRIIIYSNLVALSDEMLKELESVNVDHIQVSLYGIHPEIHDGITCVKGSCMRTIHSIERILRTRIPLIIACPVMKENRIDIIPLLDYAKKMAIPVELELNSSREWGYRQSGASAFHRRNGGTVARLDGIRQGLHHQSTPPPQIYLRRTFPICRVPELSGLYSWALRTLRYFRRQGNHLPEYARDRDGAHMPLFS